MENNLNLLETKNIVKTYHRGSDKINAVNGVSLKINKGEFVSCIGPSGSGKTTLVNILGCLDNPTEGSLTINGKEIFGENKVLSEKELTLIRRKHFGYIFQSFHLIPTLTVFENVSIPLTFYKKEGVSRKDVKSVLKSLGMGKRMSHLPGELSGGEMQRVAIARALVNKPSILFADEPTGNLDTNRSNEIGKLLIDLNKNEGITIIMVTHNLHLAEMSGRIIELKDGDIAA